MGDSTKLLPYVIALSVMSVPAAAQPARLLKDIQPGGHSYPTELTDVDGRLFFWAHKGSPPSGEYSVWTSDGTGDGTAELPISLIAGDAAIREFRGTALASVNGLFGVETRNGLWVSDGTPAGTRLILERPVGRRGGIWPAVPVNDTAYVLSSQDSGQLCSGSQSLALHRTDGSVAGTSLLVAMSPGVSTGQFIRGTSASGRNGKFYFGVRRFTCVGGVNRHELWVTDGTAGGTVALGEWPGADGGPDSLTPASGTLFFVQDDSISGFELWKSDGTAAGTVLVKDIRQGAAGSEPRWLTNVAGTLFFVADDGVAGAELWKSDGTEAGTVLVRDINPGPAGMVSDVCAPHTAECAPVNVRDRLFFPATGPDGGSELWKSDGTAAGTVLVKDIAPGVASSAPMGLSEVRGRLFFRADDGTHGSEPWASDGTATGTALYQDVEPGAEGSTRSSAGGLEMAGFELAGSQLYFESVTSAHGGELWVAPHPTPAVPNDIDGDGVADILGRGIGGEVRPWIATRTGFDQPGRWSDGFVPWRYDVHGADVDGDGREDLVSRNIDDGSVEAFRSTGSAFARLAGSGPGGAWTWGFDPATYELFFADVTGDGKADLITRVRTTVNDGGWPVGDVWVFPSTGHGFASPNVPWSYGWSHGYDLYFADVNGDKKADLVGRYLGPAGGLTGDVYLSLSTGRGFASPTRWTYGFSAGYDLYFADVDGDGRSDLTARYYGPTAGLTGDVHVMKSTGSGFAWSPGGGRWSHGWGSTYELLLRDVSGDGKADLIGRHTGTAEILVAVSIGSSFVYSGAWVTGVDTSYDLH